MKICNITLTSAVRSSSPRFPCVSSLMWKAGLHFRLWFLSNLIHQIRRSYSRRCFLTTQMIFIRRYLVSWYDTCLSMFAGAARALTHHIIQGNGLYWGTENTGGVFVFTYQNKMDFCFLDTYFLMLKLRKGKKLSQEQSAIQSYSSTYTTCTELSDVRFFFATFTSAIVF